MLMRMRPGDVDNVAQTCMLLDCISLNHFQTNLRQVMSSKVSPKVEDLVAIESAAASSPDFQFGLYNNYFPRCPDCPYISGAQTDA